MAAVNPGVQIFGLGEVSAALMSIIPRAQAAVVVATGAAAHEYEAVAKKEAPVGKGRDAEIGEFNKTPGELRRSIITIGPSPIGPFTAQAMVGPTAVYGRAVELGLQGHPIYPSEKQALWWPGMKGGSGIPGMPVSSVNWPGFSGRHYMEKALALSMAALQATYYKVMQSALT